MKSTSKPRNHVFLAMRRSRKPGAHQAQRQGNRQQQQGQLRRQIKEEGFLPVAFA